MTSSKHITQLYSRPPITEAVIAIKFDSPISSKNINSANTKFTKHYPQHQAVTNYNVQVEISRGHVEKPTTNVKGLDGHRRSTDDMTQLLVMWPSSFSISQLAPYVGWDSFLNRFIRDWKTWKRTVKYQKISGIGVRYINRIDIPFAEGSILEHENYLNVYPKLPEYFPSVDSYAIQTVLPLNKIGCRLKLNSSVIPSPIPDHLSFIIDQDIVNNSNPPQKDDAIIDLLNNIRVAKNDVFESCINDQTRALFQK